MIEELPKTVYLLVMALAGLGWLALVLFPRRPWANFWFSGLVIPIILGPLYTVVMLVYWFQNPPGKVSGFFSLAGLRELFDNGGLLLAAFIDLLVMSLLVGAWMARKAAQVRMPYVYLLPCLVLTIALPGTGIVLFAVILAIRGGWSQIARFEGQPPTNTAPVAARPDAGASS